MRRLLPALLALTACADPEPLVETPCRSDLDCPAQSLCDRGTCRPASEVRCGPPTVSVDRLDFGGGPRQPRNARVRIEDLEPCPLGTWIEVESPDGTFSCSGCPSLVSAPHRTVSVWYAPPGPGHHTGRLHVSRDDHQVSIPLSGRYEPGPRLWLEPAHLALPWTAPGASQTARVAAFAPAPPAGQWALGPPLLVGLDGWSLSVSPSTPVSVFGRSIEALQPVEWTVTFTAPTESGTGASEGSLQWMIDDAIVAELPVSANSGPPPRARVDAVPRTRPARVGERVTLEVAVANLGPGPLKVQWTELDGLPWALARPPAPATVARGATSRVALAVMPREPGRRTATLTLETNDPEHPRWQVERTLDVSPSAADAIQIQAVADIGGGDGWFVDARAYGLELRSADGSVVGPAQPEPSSLGIRWGGRGSPPSSQWLHVDSEAPPGSHEVWLVGLSDCRKVPGPVLSGLVKVGVGALGAALWRELRLGLAQGATEALARTCLARGPTAVGVEVRHGDRWVAERGAVLDRAGAQVRIGTLRKERGTVRFEVAP